MRGRNIIGFGIVIAAFVGAAVYLTQPNESIPVRTAEEVRPSAEIKPNPTEVSERADLPPSTSTSAPAEIPITLADSKRPQHPTLESANNFAEVDHLNLVKSLRLSTGDGDRLFGILVDEEKRRREWLAANKRSFISQEEENAFRVESNRLAMEFLDAATFERFDDYRKHPAERKEIDGLNERLTHNGSQGLSQEQDDQLFAAIKEEVAMTPAPLPSAYGTQTEFLTALKQWREANMKRFHKRAASLLTPDQLRLMAPGFGVDGI